MLQLPDIPGTRRPGPGDAVRATRWFKIGIRYSLAKATTRGARGYLRLLLILAEPFWPLVALKWFEFRRADRRYYFALDDTAVLALRVRNDGEWMLEDHSSQNPGTGQGLALRNIVRQRLLEGLDAGGRGLHITAADARLAADYMAEIPGLVDLGPAWPRGRRLYRPPGIPRSPD